MAGDEHALFLLLLLGYQIRDLPGRLQASLYLFAGGLLLVLLPPIVYVHIPWDLILALVVPWVFWQNAQSWSPIEMNIPRREVYLWLITAFSLVLVVVFIGDLPLLNATFFGIIAASMLWQASSEKGISTPLEFVGPLTLVFLLLERSLALDAPRRYLGGFFSGASVGIAFALISIAVKKRVPMKHEGIISLGQAYLAYWTALAIGTSAITAALISVVVFAEFTDQRFAIEGSITGSALLDNRLTFFVALGLFLFTAWQTHQPATSVLWLEVGIVLCIGFLTALLGRRWGLSRFELLISAWRSALQLGLFLLGMLILWPRGPELGSVMIWIAFGSAVFLPVLTALLLAALHYVKVRSDENPTNGYLKPDQWPKMKGLFAGIIDQVDREVEIQAKRKFTIVPSCWRYIAMSNAQLLDPP